MWRRIWGCFFRYELLARLCPNSTGAELRSVCTEAGMFAIRWTSMLKNNRRGKVANWFRFIFSSMMHQIISVWSGREGRSPLRRTSSTLCTRLIKLLFFSKRIKQDICCTRFLFQVIKSYAKFSATPKYMTYNWVMGSFPMHDLQHKHSLQNMLKACVNLKLKCLDARFYFPSNLPGLTRVQYWKL